MITQAQLSRLSHVAPSKFPGFHNPVSRRRTVSSAIDGKREPCILLFRRTLWPRICRWRLLCFWKCNTLRIWLLIVVKEVLDRKKGCFGLLEFFESL